LLDADGGLEQTINNFSRISFNFGPNLLAWLELNVPDVYRGIQQADRDSAGLYGGHGSALAQAYGHLILPLASARDRETAIAWGLDDFRRRFGRRAEGMWLPETAVDTATLSALAAAGLRFCLLAPRQAAAVRGDGDTEYSPVNEKTLDTGRPYRVDLPDERSIVAFFYDGALAQQLAFGDLLQDGATFASSILERHRSESDSRLVHVATDGESYGHHHTFGEMALARALGVLEDSGATLTNYGQYLDDHPPTATVKIVENSSWSCPHELGRWSRDCGCASEYHEGYHQRWREPLKLALDELRNDLHRVYLTETRELATDPSRLRDGYNGVRMSPDRPTADERLNQLAGRRLDSSEHAHLLAALEMDRLALLTGTSCAWFFEEVSRIEPVQILRYADRALDYASRWDKGDAAGKFRERLRAIPSNNPEIGDAATLFDREVIRARVSPETIAMWTSLRRTLRLGEETLPWSASFRDDVRVTFRGQHRSADRVAGTVTLEARHDRRLIRSAFCWIEDGPSGLFGGLLGPDAAPHFPALGHELATMDGTQIHDRWIARLDPVLVGDDDLETEVTGT